MKAAFAKLLQAAPVMSSHVDFKAGGNNIPIVTRASGLSTDGYQNMGLPGGNKPYPGGGANKTVLGAIRMGDTDGNAPASAIYSGDIFYPPGLPDRVYQEVRFESVGNNVFQPEGDSKATYALLKALGDKKFKAIAAQPFEDYLRQDRISRDLDDAARNASLEDVGKSRAIIRQMAAERRQQNEDDYLRRMLDAGMTPEAAKKEIEDVRNANALQEAKKVDDRTYQAKTLIQRMAMKRGVISSVNEPLTQSGAIDNPQMSMAMSAATGNPGDGFGSSPLDVNRQFMTADFYKKFLKRSTMTQEAADEMTAQSQLFSDPDFLSQLNLNPNHASAIPVNTLLEDKTREFENELDEMKTNIISYVKPNTTIGVNPISLDDAKPRFDAPSAGDLNRLRPLYPTLSNPQLAKIYYNEEIEKSKKKINEYNQQVAKLSSDYENSVSDIRQPTSSAATQGAYSLATLKGQERQAAIDSVSENLEARLDVIRNRSKKQKVVLVTPYFCEQIIIPWYSDRKPGDKVVGRQETIQEMDDVHILYQLNKILVTTKKVREFVGKLRGMGQLNSDAVNMVKLRNDLKRMALDMGDQITDNMPFPGRSVRIVPKDLVDMINEFRNSHATEVAIKSLEQRVGVANVKYEDVIEMDPELALEIAEQRVLNLTRRARGGTRKAARNEPGFAPQGEVPGAGLLGSAVPESESQALLESTRLARQGGGGGGRA